MSIYQVPFHFDRREFDAQYPILLSGRVSEAQWHSTIDRCNGVVRACINRIHSTRRLSIALGVGGFAVVAIFIFVFFVMSPSSAIASSFLLMPLAIIVWGVLILVSLLATTSAMKSAIKQCQERMAQVLEAEKAMYTAQGVQFIYRQQGIRQQAGYGEYGRPRRGHHGLVLVPSLDVIIVSDHQQQQQYHQQQQQQQYQQYPYNEYQHQHQHQYQYQHGYDGQHQQQHLMYTDPHTAPYPYVPQQYQQQHQQPYSDTAVEVSKQPSQPPQQRQQQQQGPVYYSGPNSTN